MKTLLVIFSFALFGVSISSCRERFRRQMWGAPPSSDLFWGGHSPEYHNNDNFFDQPDQSWNSAQQYDRPFQPQSNFQGGWDDDDVDSYENSFSNFNSGFDNFGNFDSGSRQNNQNNNNNRQQNNQNNRPNNQNNRQNNQNKRQENQNKRRNQNKRQNQNQNQNQNRRTTTENLGPITSTPRTIHYAPKGCQCPMTQQFNPVCGTDGNTYRNEGLLNCYVRCGTNVSRKRLGTC